MYEHLGWQGAVLIRGQGRLFRESDIKMRLKDEQELETWKVGMEQAFQVEDAASRKSLASGQEAGFIVQ